ncbi:MAG: hypothetical protein ACI4PX_07125, partial [Ruminococcus sp.]
NCCTEKKDYTKENVKLTDAERSKIRYERMKELHRCVCCGGKDYRTSEGLVYCHVCAEKRKAYSRNLVNLHICVQCGTKDGRTLDGHWRCNECTKGKSVKKRKKVNQFSVKLKKESKDSVVCPECKKEFEPKSVNQIYCSSLCGERYRRKHPEYIRTGNTVLKFQCAYCGKTVVTDGKGDKRTRFCCQSCEKKYWRHPPSEHSSLRTENAKFLEWYEKHSE